MAFTENDKPSLHEIATRFFQKKDFEVQENVTLLGESGKKHKIELIAKIEADVQINKIAIKILDWKRSVGVDRLIRFERILNDLNGMKGMMISNAFSTSAKNFAKRRGIVLYSRKNLLLLLEEK
ncbi:MAG: hypothetical protein GF308_12570 [Candidatus Heimdallarchaeota archaeon]|nr:hypothetical protein [Candidatus Heimdallarchaeota archaeon]